MPASSETAQVVALDRDARHIRRDRYAASAAGPEPAAGVLVDPTPATADMGRIFLDYKVASAVEQIKKLAAAEVRRGGRRRAALRPRRVRIRRFCGLERPISLICISVRDWPFPASATVRCG